LKVCVRRGFLKNKIKLKNHTRKIQFKLKIERLNLGYDTYSIARIKGSFFLGGSDHAAVHKPVIAIFLVR
jgi:hypothetical protein